MTKPEPDTTDVTVGIVVAAIACCALPLLVTAGVLTSAGVAFQNLLLIALGAGVLGWAITRVVRTLRARDRSADPTEHTRT